MTSESEPEMSDVEGTVALFHGKFIPNDPHPRPLVGRIAIGIGLALVILVLAAASEDVFGSWGTWVTLLFLLVFTPTTLVLWIRDARLHPATAVDGTE
jgi:hypothetical protein